MTRRSMCRVLCLGAVMAGVTGCDDALAIGFVPTTMTAQRFQTPTM